MRKSTAKEIVAINGDEKLISLNGNEKAKFDDWPTI
jgi:hypothetical protein